MQIDDFPLSFAGLISTKFLSRANRILQAVKDLQVVDNIHLVKKVCTTRPENFKKQKRKSIQIVLNG